MLNLLNGISASMADEKVIAQQYGSPETPIFELA
jgi:hypothetical protein